MNAVVAAVLVMLILATFRVHVVLSLFLGALVGGLLSGIGLVVHASPCPTRCSGPSPWPSPTPG